MRSVGQRAPTRNDFFRTICHSLSIIADKQNMSSIGRPIKIVDGGGGEGGVWLGQHVRVWFASLRFVV
ncbi:MAG TPA: hypothetical protein VMP01_17095 [Pirellulaceae bacterium]|nr:hypothetical protein [Pirellulaceae bacterium]